MDNIFFHYSEPDDFIPSKTLIPESIGPGPAAYSFRDDFCKNLPKISIKIRPSAKMEEITPGYTIIPCDFGSVARISLKGRTIGKTEITPGPYFIPSDFGESKSMKIGTKCEKPINDPTPGPGDYSPIDFSTSRRINPCLHGSKGFSLALMSESPGPGKYNINDGERLKSPSITIGKRFNQSLKDELPGPGQYNVLNTQKTPRNAVSIGKKLYGRDSKENIEPGPGDYYCEKSVIHGIPKVYMHCRTKETKEVIAAPYQNTRNYAVSSPMYSMRSRFFSKPEITPGTLYSPPPFAHNSPSVSISPRYKEKARIDSPGPAHYSSPNTIGQQQYKPSFHGPKERMIIKSIDSPSPAEYSPDYSRIKPSSPRIKIKGEW